jgi:hypothetical protein
MKRFVRGLLVGSLLLLAAVAVSAEGKLTQTPYYPLQVGTTWHYKSGDATFTIRVTRHEKVGEVLCARLEVNREGKVVAWQHLAVTAEGVYSHDLTEQRAGKAIVQTPKPPMLVLKLPPKKGDAWKVDSKANGKTFRGAFRIDEEKIKVAAGDYETVRVTSQDLEVNALKPILTTYYARGVGMVKQVIQVGEVTTVIELEKFEAGK